MAKKRKFIKDLTRVGQRINKQRRKGNSPLWRRKALALWSFLVRALAGFKCEVCGVPETQKILNAHHVLPKERYQWLMFAPVNGLCLCQNCHKTGRHSAHLNPLWFSLWLKINKMPVYNWALDRCMKEPKDPPNFNLAYNHLYRRIHELGFGPVFLAKKQNRAKKSKDIKARIKHEAQILRGDRSRDSRPANGRPPSQNAERRRAGRTH